MGVCELAGGPVTCIRVIERLSQPGGCSLAAGGSVCAFCGSIVRSIVLILYTLHFG